ncbi:hypothetical protein QFZ91_003711 [Paraburkholderia sp. JPY419]
MEPIRDDRLISNSSFDMRAHNMHRSVPPSATRTAAAVLMATALGLASLANAQTPAQPMAQTLSQAAPPVDPSFSAYSLVQSCKQRHDNVAQGQCVSAIRGIIHGYQYGVLFLAQRATFPANETQRVSLCLSDVPVSSDRRRLPRRCRSGTGRRTAAHPRRSRRARLRASAPPLHLSAASARAASSAPTSLRASRAAAPQRTAAAPAPTTSPAHACRAAA